MFPQKSKEAMSGFLPKISDSKGSFIVEVLLSIVILSVSVTMIMRAMTNALRAAQYSSEYARAAVFLENKMAALLAGEKNESTLETPEDLSDTGEGQHYAVTADDSDLSEQGYLRKSLVAVEWRSGGKRHVLESSTLLFERPPE